MRRFWQGTILTCQNGLGKVKTAQGLFSSDTAFSVWLITTRAPKGHRPKTAPHRTMSDHTYHTPFAYFVATRSTVTDNFILRYWYF